MNEKSELQKVSEEIMRFMRGKYVLDEVLGKYYDEYYALLDPPIRN